MQGQIYSLEDDTNIGYIINKTLTSAGFNVVTFTTAKQFFAAFSLKKPDLILLDLMLPDGDGLDILKKIKKEKNTPVIIISAKNYEVDKVIGLDSGADDYITKPFGALELISRVKVALRRNDAAKDETITYQNIVLNRPQRTCFIGNTEVLLTAKEFALLLMLIENQGHVIPRDDIFKNVWGYDFIGESRTLDMHINYLRKKLSNYDAKFLDMIKTIRGVGYMVIKND